MPPVDSAGEPPGTERHRLLVGIVTMHLLWFEAVSSQRAHGVFGPAMEIPLGKVPAGLLVFVGPGGPEMDVVRNDPPGIDAFGVAERGGLVYRSTYRLRARCRSWEAVELDPQGGPAFLGLTASADTLVIARRKAGAEFSETRVPLEARPQRLLVTDIDHDHRKEILLFGKSMAGIQVLKRRPGGAFVPGPLLFPDLSAAAVAVTDLNGDGIPDIFIANWLSNQVAVFFGIARNVFSEQLTIELEAEPGGLSLTPVSRQRTLELAVLMPVVKTIAVFTGNGAGEFRRIASVSCPFAPQQAQCMDLNGDGLPDLIVAGEKGIQTILARSATAFESPVVYGVGNVVGRWRIADLGGSRRGALVCADRPGRRLIVSSRVPASSPAAFPGSLTYLAGERPQGVFLADVNGDGLRDIVVANQGSSSVSCYLNTGSGGFSPQVTIETAERPWIIRPIEGDSRRFLVTHRGEGKLSVVSTAVWDEPAVFSIPTAPDPVVLRALHRNRSEPLRILVSSRGGAQQSATFSLFEQLTGKNFLEKTFTAVLPTAFRGITTASIANDAGTDLLFLTADRGGRKYTLSCASAGEGFDYSSVQSLLSFVDSTASIRAIQAVDVDGDGLEDLVVVGNGGRKGVGVMYAREPGKYDPEIRWIGGISNISGQVLVEDLDGDSFRDCVVIDHSSQTVRVVYGSGRRGFSAPRDVVPAQGAGSFDVGPLFDPASRDLVLTSEAEGAISIFHNPFSR